MLLNVDTGECPDEPEGLVEHAHLVHVACGGHAGDAATMRSTLRRARTRGTRAGAHPSFPDREGFGRRSMDLPYDALAASLREQLQTLAAIAREEDIALTSLKPHGALYHASNRDPRLAALLAELTRESCVGAASLVGPPSGELRRAAGTAGILFLREGFADRAYEPAGTLRDRGEPGALLVDPAAAVAQSRALAPHVDTLCVHGDAPAALAILRALREAFP